MGHDSAPGASVREVLKSSGTRTLDAADEILAAEGVRKALSRLRNRATPIAPLTA
jgi:hypothetical protein